MMYLCHSKLDLESSVELKTQTLDPDFHWDDTERRRFY